MPKKPGCEFDCKNCGFLVAKLVHSLHCWRNLKPLQLPLDSAAIEVLRGEKNFRMFDRLRILVCMLLGSVSMLLCFILLIALQINIPEMFHLGVAQSRCEMM